MTHKLEITKIHAEGCDKRFMTIKLDDTYAPIRIPPYLYEYLKTKGVPTSQSLRKKKNENV